MNKKLLYLGIYLLILLTAPYAVYENIRILYGLNWNLLTVLNFIQRSAALIAFLMISMQIFLGYFMDKVTDKLGGFVYTYHVWEGAIIYSLILTHTLTYLLSFFVSSKLINPFYVFVDICVICNVNAELFYSMGRIAFWLISVTVFTALFRKYIELRRNWRIFHLANYAIFILVGVHSFFIGSDVHTIPYFIFYIIACGLGVFTISYKLISNFKSNFRLK